MKNTVIKACGKDFSYLQKFIRGNISPLCVYGCGVNGEVIGAFLNKHGADIDFFIDRQAEAGEFKILGRKVISPDVFIENYKNEKIIVTPDNHTTIVQWLIENGIRREDIIVPFKDIEKEVRIFEDDYEPQKPKREHGQKKSQKPEATFFTILYNTPSGMLCRAIESVLNQSYDNFKYIIIDNGSTDGSAEIIKRYCKLDDRIIYIRLEKNVVWTDKNLLAILKKNIDTDYVAMLDSDDYYEMDFLQKSIYTAKTQKADMVQVNTLTYAHEGFRYSYFTHYLGEDICVEGKEKEKLFMQRIIFVPVWGKLFSGILFNHLMEMMLSFESDDERDRNFCLDISWITFLVFQCKRIALCDEILHIRSWRPGSSEHSDDHSSKWLSSIIWSFNHLRDAGISYEDSKVFEESQLMWLFNLPRENVGLSHFRTEDLAYRRVKEFINRPVCHRYRGF